MAIQMPLTAYIKATLEICIFVKLMKSYKQEELTFLVKRDQALGDRLPDGCSNTTILSATTENDLTTDRACLSLGFKINLPIGALPRD
jgi:hypothetical protein